MKIGLKKIHHLGVVAMYGMLLALCMCALGMGDADAGVAGVEGLKLTVGVHSAQVKQEARPLEARPLVVLQGKPVATSVAAQPEENGGWSRERVFGILCLLGLLIFIAMGISGQFESSSDRTMAQEAAWRHDNGYDTISGSN